MSSIVVGEWNSCDDGPLRPVSSVELSGNCRLKEQMIVEPLSPGEGKRNKRRAQQHCRYEQQLRPLVQIALVGNGGSPRCSEQESEGNNGDEVVPPLQIDGPPGKKDDEAANWRESY